MIENWVANSESLKSTALRSFETNFRVLNYYQKVIHATETRSSESSDQREVRLETNRIRTNQIRSSERSELRERRLQNVRISTARSRRTLHADLNLSAFHYDSNNEYSLHSNVVIGKMDKICMYCSALKFKNETRGMCCAGGKVKLPELHSPPEPLSTFLSAVTRVSKHFLENIRKYNSCFQMTSFGATNIVRENYMPTSSVHCSSEQYRMLLSKIAVDQYTWTNILPRFKNSQRSAVRYLSTSLPRTKSS
ncbi:uncharacterized protein TNCV_3627951 [Trichonephila clavipes]|nr:uncharacterized protein TNCV_3627951 [Trichonephila clavipes]